MANLTIQPATSDTFIASNVPTTNFDTNNRIVVSHDIPDRGLLNFDFSAIPSNSVINSATLSLYVNNLDSGVEGRTHDVNRVTQISWISSQATWNNYITSTAWSSAGGDFTTTDKASAVVPAADNWMDWDVQTLVQWFLDNASGIGDFLIKDASEAGGAGVAAYFRSNSDGESSTKPKLVINYTPPIIVTPSVLPITTSILSPADVTDNVMLPSTLTIAATLPVPISGMIETITPSVSPITATLLSPLVITDVIIAPSVLAITASLLAPVILTYNPLVLEATLPSHTLEANIPAIITLNQNLPALTLEATCKSGQILTLEATLPALTLQSHMGMHMVAKLPALTLESTLTVGGVMSLNRILPALTLEASMTSGRALTLTANLPALTLSANLLNGNILTLAQTLLALTLEANSTTGNNMSLSKNLPAHTLVSTINSSENLTLTATLPALELEAFADSYLDRYI